MIIYSNKCCRPRAKPLIDGVIYPELIVTTLLDLAWGKRGGLKLKIDQAIVLDGAIRTSVVILHSIHHSIHDLGF